MRKVINVTLQMALELYNIFSRSSIK